MITANQPTIFDKKKLLTAVASSADGTMKILPDDGGEGMKNRLRFFEKIGVDPAQVVMMFVGDHTKWDHIHDVKPTDAGAGMFDDKPMITTDALVTNQKGVALLLNVADCSPVIIHDPVQDVLALVHLGWQSTAIDLAGKVIAHLSEQYSSKPGDMRIYNGPSIRANSYVLDSPIAQENMPGWAGHLIRRDDGKIGIDLLGYNRQQFLQAGVLDKHIEICDVDTATSPQYFSHYRALRSGDKKDDGRFATVCMLK